METGRDGRAERRVLAAIFVASGFSGLVYQVVLGRYIHLVTGATAYAISATLVAFMAGTSVGAALGGAWADRVRRPLALYALAEIAIGAYCAAFPWMFPLFERAHLALAADLSRDALVLRNAVRFVVAAAAFVVPAFAMGVTTPAFAKAVAQHRTDQGRWLARLYGWNTMGAALGALTTAYVLVPTVGMASSLWIGATINAIVAIVAFRLAKGDPPGTRDSDEPGPEAGARALSLSARQARGLLVLAEAALAALATHTLISQAVDGNLVTTLLPAAAASALWAALLLRRVSGERAAIDVSRLGLHVIAFASGLISFGLEVIWTHVLAVLLGNSVYSFGVMLGALLTGLTLGAAIARRLAEPAERARRWLGLAFLLSGAAVLWTIELWDLVPNVFLAMAWASPGFALMELVRFAVATLLMLLPTLFLGISFPMALRCAAAGRDRFGTSVGSMYSINAVGAVLGSLLAAYWLLPRFGSLASLKMLASALLLVGSAALWSMAGGLRGAAKAVVAASLAAWCLFLGASWDFQRLNTAAAIYLGESGSQGGEIVYQREDATGGFTTVVARDGIKTLLTNGKFQGDDGAEIPIQHRLALLPALLTSGRERALVIGLGTGVTLAALASHGFDEVVCAEISPVIVDAARQQFGHVNHGVLDAPGVRMVEDDGRNVLQESRQRYDVVSVQASTIWFSGVGAIYSREFYSLVSERLRRGGLLLQWFPIHHLSARNLYLVVNTARAVFPYVSVWRHKHQGFLVASPEPQRIDLASVRADDVRPEAQDYLGHLATGSHLELVADLVVADGDTDAFLDSLGQLLRLHRDVVSTDSWPTLEYETPKDVLDNLLYFQNLAILQRFRSLEPPPFRGEPTERERELARGAFTRGWNDPRSLPRLAELAAGSDRLGATAIAWLEEELAGPNGTGSGLAELLAQRSRLDELLAAAPAEVQCEPVPRPFSRAADARMELVSHDGTVLEATHLEALTDGVADPRTTKGLHLRSAGRATTLAFDLAGPVRLAEVGLAATSLDSHAAALTVTGRLADGSWRLLASHALAAAASCAEARIVRFDPPTPAVDGLRFSIRGEVDYQRLAAHEVWAKVAEAQP